MIATATAPEAHGTNHQPMPLPPEGERRSALRGYGIRLERSKRSNAIGTIGGLALRYGTLSEELPGGFRERFAKGCATEALEISDVRCLFNFDVNNLLGRSPTTMRITETAEGVSFVVSSPGYRDRSSPVQASCSGAPMAAVQLCVANTTSVHSEVTR